MSWIRDHFAHFVIPAMRAMIRHRDGKPRPREVKPLDVIVRPAAVCKYQESGLVYTTVASMLSKQDKRRGPLLELCRTLDPTGFVGPEAPKLSVQGAGGADIVHSIVWNSLRTLKRHSRKLGGAMILPGRDVWPWEVISRRQRLRTVYDGRVSRAVADHTTLLAGIAKEWPIQDPEWDRSLVFDTGWNGSIHRLLCKATMKAPHSFMLSASDSLRAAQLFPGHTGSRAKAIAIERFPKYFERATVPDGKELVQDFESFEEFVKTALLTIWLWHYVSPRHIAALKERAAAIKEAQKKHKMQIEGPHDLVDNMGNNGGYKFSGAVAGVTGVNFGTTGYIQAPYLNTGTVPFVFNNNSASTIGGTVQLQVTQNGQGLQYVVPVIQNGEYVNTGAMTVAQHLAQKNAANDLISTQPMTNYDDTFYPAKKKTHYGGYSPPSKKTKVKLSAETLIEMAQTFGKAGAQDLIDTALEEAETIGEIHGSHMAIQGPTGPTHYAPVSDGILPKKLPGPPIAYAGLDGKTEYLNMSPIVQDMELAQDLKALSNKPKTYIDPNDFKLKSVQSNLPVATDASGKPLFA